MMILSSPNLIGEKDIHYPIRLDILHCCRKNPHRTLPRRKKQAEEDSYRLQQGIACFNAVSSPSAPPLAGFPQPVPYMSHPLTRYQSWLRAPGEDHVQYHYTRKYTTAVVERYAFAEAPIYTYLTLLYLDLSMSLYTPMQITEV